MSNDKLQAKLKIINADFEKGREILLGLQKDVKKTNEELLKLQSMNSTVDKIVQKWKSRAKSDIEKIATVSTNRDWDDLFLKTNGLVATVALKKYYQGIGGLNINNLNTPLHVIYP